MNTSEAKATRVQRSALVPFTARQMFDLVQDVESYPEFLPWCRRASVDESGGTRMLATLEIAKGPLRKSFTTENRIQAPERIDIALVKGPFRSLDGTWTFQDLEGDGARVSLEMRFEMAGALLGRTLAPIFSEIASTLVDAFCQRARALYGGS